MLAKGDRAAERGSPLAMPHIQASVRSPWSAAVPLQAGRFVSLFAKHQSCNRITDFAALASFGVPQPLAPTNLGFADYQLDPQYAGPRRQGAGRAVFHGAYYLKGAGRTPLALDWHDHRDAPLTTGHLPPSAGLRELVVSRYLRAKGLAQHVVACEGLLIAPLARELGEPLVRAYARRGIQLAPSDLHMQAISVKPANFARWSNILWLAHQTAPEPESVLEFAWLCEHFALARGPREHNLPHPETCSPSTIAASLSAALSRGFAALETCFRHGLYLGGIGHEDVTLDGRILDLETPLISGEALLCKHSTAPASAELGRSGRPFGIEFLLYARTVRRALETLDARLGVLERRAACPGVAVFLGQLRASLSAEFGSSHPIHNAQSMRAGLTQVYRETGAPDALISRVIDAQVAHIDHQLELPPLSARRVATSFAATAPGLRTELTILEGAPGLRSTQAAAERELLFELYTELDSITDPARYLSRLRSWIGRIDAEVRPTGALPLTAQPPQAAPSGKPRSGVHPSPLHRAPAANGAA